jgi:H+/Cl- antiporter ClcA
MRLLNFEKHLKNNLLSLAIGLGSGALVSFFLHSLAAITQWRLDHPLFIFGLPFVGFAMPWLYRRFGFGAERGLSLVLEEIHEPRQIVPWSMGPLIYLTTLLTHLVGGSAGREGTALQMSAAFADRLGRWFQFSWRERHWILTAGLGAGFSAALGAPWAGFLFGAEALHAKGVRRPHFLLLAVASFTAWSIAIALETPHFEKPFIPTPQFSVGLLMTVALLGFVIAGLCRLHIETVHRLEQVFRRLPVPWRTAAGGSLLLLLYLIFPWQSYQGLSLEGIRAAFTETPPLGAPLIKLFLTALTLAAGFKGGEFVPLVFIGATTGSTLAAGLHGPQELFTALGFIALFAAASKTPWTCSLLAIEYFGWSVAPYAFFVNHLARWLSGKKGIY